MTTEEIWKSVLQPIDLSEFGDDKVRFEDLANFRKVWDEGDARAITVLEKLLTNDTANFKVVEDLFFVDMFFKGAKSSHAFFAKRCLGLVQSFVNNGIHLKSFFATYILFLTEVCRMW